jgi:phosphate transport system protein
MTRVGFASSLQDVRNRTLALASMVDKAIARAVEAYETWDVQLSNEVVAADDQINDARWDIEEEVILILARQAPMAGDLRELITIIHIATELERMGDYAKVVARTVADAATPPDVQSMHLITDLAALGREQLSGCMEAFVENDAPRARRIAKRDDKLDLLWHRIYRELLTEMVADPELVPEASGLLWIAHNFERMGDRVTNICERIVYAATGRFEENVHLAGTPSDDVD